MKKRSLVRQALLCIMLASTLLLSSCALWDELIQYVNPIENASAPYFKYDPITNTTEASLSVRFSGGLPDSQGYKIKSFSFSVEFYDASGNLIDERLCELRDPEEHPQRFVRFYQFGGSYGGDILPPIEGNAVSVKYRALDNPSVYENEDYNADGSMKWRLVDTVFTLAAILIFAAAVPVTVLLGDDGVEHQISMYVFYAAAIILFMLYHFYLRAFCINF